MKICVTRRLVIFIQFLLRASKLLSNCSSNPSLRNLLRIKCESIGDSKASYDKQSNTNDSLVRTIPYPYSQVAELHILAMLMPHTIQLRFLKKTKIQTKHKSSIQKHTSKIRENGGPLSKRDSKTLTVSLQIKVIAKSSCDTTKQQFQKVYQANRLATITMSLKYSSESIVSRNCQDVTKTLDI